MRQARGLAWAWPQPAKLYMYNPTRLRLPVAVMKSELRFRSDVVPKGGTQHFLDDSPKIGPLESEILGPDPDPDPG